jgi:hypothetical protein
MKDVGFVWLVLLIVCYTLPTITDVSNAVVTQTMLLAIGFMITTYAID